MEDVDVIVEIVEPYTTVTVEVLGDGPDPEPEYCAIPICGCTVPYCP